MGNPLNVQAVTWAAPKLLSLLPEVWCSPSWCTRANVTQLGRAGEMLTLLTYTLRDLCSLLSWKRPNYFSICSVTRTHHCHQSPAVKWPSACTARCLHSILIKYIPHLLQRYVPDTSILQAGSGLGPWKGSLRISSVQNKCHKSLFFFNAFFGDGGCSKLLQELAFVTLWITLWLLCYKKNAGWGVIRSRFQMKCFMGQIQIWNHSVKANRLTPGICLLQCA